tara:strand:- start:1055 stop:1300 length:246 start_codon:yes stop_codon:yes gene_type:complete
MKKNNDYCPRCKKVVKWIYIPDSLASTCKRNCGYVRVNNMDGTYSPGASMQKWINDTYGKDLPDIPDPKSNEEIEHEKTCE